MVISATGGAFRPYRLPVTRSGHLKFPIRRLAVFYTDPVGEAATRTQQLCSPAASCDVHPIGNYSTTIRRTPWHRCAFRVRFRRRMVRGVRG